MLHNHICKHISQLLLVSLWPNFWSALTFPQLLWKHDHLLYRYKYRDTFSLFQTTNVTYSYLPMGCHHTYMVVLIGTSSCVILPVVALKGTYSITHLFTPCHFTLGIKFCLIFIHTVKKVGIVVEKWIPNFALVATKKGWNCFIS